MPNLPRGHVPALILGGLFLVIAACTPATVATPTPGEAPPPTPPPPPGTLAGAATARSSVEEFLAAVRAEDIQAMIAVWGTPRGSVRETLPREEAERRAVIMQCYLAHDRFQIMSESFGENGRRIFSVALMRGNQTRQPAIFTVPGPRQRWYVENVELAAVRDFCGMPTGTGRGR